MTDEAKFLAGYLRIAYAESAPAKMRFIEAADLIESISAELEQVKRERDAAVEDLRTHGVLCVLCLHEKKSVNEEPCKSCSHASTSNRHTNWQWRGVKEGSHD